MTGYENAGAPDGSIDERHLLMVGAGPGLGQAIARRFAEGGYRLILLGLTIAGQIVAGTPFDPQRIAGRFWEIVESDGDWQAEFRFTGG